MTFFDSLKHGASVNGEAKQDAFEYDPWRRLAAEIVISAVEDWRLLIIKKEWEKGASTRTQINFDSIRFFFKSQWCAFLMMHFSTTPEAILQLLENELEDAKKADGRELAKTIQKYRKNMRCGK